MEKKITGCKFIIQKTITPRTHAVQIFLYASIEGKNPTSAASHTFIARHVVRARKKEAGAKRVNVNNGFFSSARARARNLIIERRARRSGSSPQPKQTRRRRRARATGFYPVKLCQTLLLNPFRSRSYSLSRAPPRQQQLVNQPDSRNFTPVFRSITGRLWKSRCFFLFRRGESVAR